MFGFSRDGVGGVLLPWRGDKTGGKPGIAVPGETPRSPLRTSIRYSSRSIQRGRQTWMPFQELTTEDIDSPAFPFEEDSSAALAPPHFWFEDDASATLPPRFYET